jgi:hypothetical protein
VLRRRAARDACFLLKHIRFCAALLARRDRRLTAFLCVVDLIRAVIRQRLLHHVRQFEFFTSDSAFEFRLVLRHIRVNGLQQRRLTIQARRFRTKAFHIAELRHSIIDLTKIVASQSAEIPAMSANQTNLFVPI